MLLLMFLPSERHKLLSSSYYRSRSDCTTWSPIGWYCDYHHLACAEASGSSREGIFKSLIRSNGWTVDILLSGGPPSSHTWSQTSTQPRTCISNFAPMYSHCGCWNNRLTWILGSLVRWIHCGSMSGYGVHTEMLVDRGRKITWSTCRRCPLG